MDLNGDGLCTLRTERTTARQKNLFGGRYTPPEEGWSNNIMGEFYGSVEEKNIIELLDINNVIAKRVIGYDD